MNLGPTELIVLLVILLLLFGAARLPKLARSIGQAGRELKEGMREGSKPEPVEGECPFCGANVPAESGFCPGCAKPAEEIVAERGRQKKSA